MMFQKVFHVFVCDPHSTCLTFPHATACTAVSSTNSFPALSLPDPLSAEHQHNQSNHNQTHSLSPLAGLHIFIPPLAQPRKSRNCMLTVIKTPQSPQKDIRVRVFLPASLPSCTVRCHLSQCEKIHPLIVLV